MADLPYPMLALCLVHNRRRFTVVCKLHLSCVKNVMTRYSRVNFSGQGQLRSIIVLL